MSLVSLPHANKHTVQTAEVWRTAGVAVMQSVSLTSPAEQAEYVGLFLCHVDPRVDRGYQRRIFHLI